MTSSEIVAIMAVILSVGTNVALYVHLSSTMNTGFNSVDVRFESVERRLVMIQGAIHELVGKVN